MYDPASQGDNPTDAATWSYESQPDSRKTRSTTVEGFSRHGGLETDWVRMSKGGLVYCNPPYGRHLKGTRPEPDREITFKDEVTGHGTGWAAKMAAHEGEGIYLVPSRTETRWWRRLYGWSDWALLWSSPTLGARLTFQGARSPAPFPSTLFYKGPRVGRFLSVFAPHGTIIPGEHTKRLLIEASLNQL